MASYSISDFGALCTARTCGAVSATAGGSGDNTAVTGATVDRLGFGSAKVCVAWKTTLGASETLALAVEYQDSDDGTTWNTAVALQASTTVKTGAVTNEHGMTEFNLNLATLGRYVRINFTPDLSAATTDTAIVSAAIILGGASTLPASYQSS